VLASVVASIVSVLPSVVPVPEPVPEPSTVVPKLPPEAVVSSLELELCVVPGSSVVLEVAEQFSRSSR